MAFWRKFLYPVIRQSLIRKPSSCSSISLSRRLFHGKLESLKGPEPLLGSRASRFQWKLNAQRKRLRNFYFSGSKLGIGSVIGFSAVIGSISFWSRVGYSMDGRDILVHDDHVESSCASDFEEEPYSLWTFARKFWLPIFFLVTLWMHLDRPITIIATKVILFLLTTKPSRFSVYVFVDELCHQCMRQEPQLYYLKSLYAHKVEVQDYQLFCIATVEVRDQKFILIGILGGWWAWSRSPSP
nr:uncharacterized protein LOC107415488 isoform X1 [Ziziphus jujuba var. spinosa]